MGDVIKAGVRCDGCSSRFLPSITRRKEGKQEALLFVCPFCEREYLVGVTDADLRKGISAYIKLALENRKHRLPLDDQIRMQSMKAAILKREQELTVLYQSGGTDGKEKEDSGTAGDEHSVADP